MKRWLTPLLFAATLVALFPANSQAMVDMLAPPPVKKCVNLGGGLEAPREGDWGYRIRKEHIVKIAEAGFDSVRIPVRFSVYADENPPYQLTPDILKRVDEVIIWAFEAGLRPIIDLHHYEELMQEPDLHEPRLKAIWQQLAEHYKNWPEELIFEIVNEPNGAMTRERTQKLNSEILADIRTTNPERWVVLGAGEWGNHQGFLQAEMPDDRYILPTFHYYEPFSFTHQGAHWTSKEHPTGQTWGSRQDRKQLAQHFAEVAAWAKERKLKVFLGEFGVYRKADLSERERWTKAVRKQAEWHNIGWCHWDWATGFPLYDEDSESWIEPMLKALMN